MKHLYQASVLYLTSQAIATLPNVKIVLFASGSFCKNINVDRRGVYSSQYGFFRVLGFLQTEFIYSLHFIERFERAIKKGQKNAPKPLVKPHVQ